MKKHSTITIRRNVNSMSIHDVNYKLRPAKAVERKMLCESFRHLRTLARLDSFRYIGFGSLFFSDFVLFHRALNIKSMVSIEKDNKRAERYKFNLPYKCIELKIGRSNDVLPKLIWPKTPSIVWLDYDGELTTDVLNDLLYLCDNIEAPSIVLISVNAHPGEHVDADGNDRLERLKKNVGGHRVPTQIKAKDLAQWGKANVLRDIFDDEVKNYISTRNGRTEKQSEKLAYQQLFNFHYADNAKMLTVGGLIFKNADQAKIASAGFDTLPWYSGDSTNYLIQVPTLSIKEVKHLDMHIHSPIPLTELANVLSDSDIAEYKKIYRFFPTFTEAADL